MGRQDQGATRADAQPLVHRYAALDQRISLGDQRIQRQHDTVTDQALHTVTQNPRGNQVQDGLLTVDDQRVAGVVAALKAHNGRRAIRQEVDNLSLALVTPLGPDDNYVLTHDSPSSLLPRIDNQWRLSAHDIQDPEADDHHHETDIADVIVTQARDFRHHLAVFSRRDERQHALQYEHKSNCRENLCSYC